MPKGFTLFSSLLSLLLFSHNLWAGDFDFRGEAFFEPKLYRSDNNATTKDMMHTLGGRVELSYDHGKKRWSENLQVYAQTDLNDQNRSELIIEEANINYAKKKNKFGFGYYVFNWTALEVFHPADIINSRYFDSDIKNFTKVGELTLSYTRFIRYGVLNVYLFPLLTSPKFPKETSRMNFFGTSVGDSLWLTPDGKIANDNSALQFALLWERTWRSLDFTLHLVNQMDKNHPLYTTALGQLQPVFVGLWQLGGTLQMAQGDWLFKAEGAIKDFDDVKNTSLGSFQQKDHSVIALGAEYYLSHASGKDSNFFMELQSLIGLTEDEAFDTNFFQRDFFLGYRLSFNDIYSKEITASIVYDLQRANEHMIHFNFRRRLTDVYTFSVGFNLIEAFRDDPTPNGLEVYSRNNEIFVKLSRFF